MRGFCFWLFELWFRLGRSRFGLWLTGLDGLGTLYILIGAIILLELQGFLNLAFLLGLLGLLVIAR